MTITTEKGFNGELFLNRELWDGFAREIYRRLPDAGNLVFSPYSLRAVLSMVSQGAVGQTKTEIEKAVRISPGWNQEWYAHAALSHELKSQSEVLQIANAIFVDRTIGPPNCAVNLADGYGAIVEEVDFLGQAEKVRQRINGWASDRTHGKIQELFAPGDLDQMLVIMANAIYFKGEWEKKFDKAITRIGPFNAPRSGSSAQFMQQSNQFGYIETEGVQLLRMPFLRNFSMVLALPDDGILSHAMDVLLGSIPDKLYYGAAHKQVYVRIPKFKMDSAFEFKSVLQDLGMKAAFSGEADFSGFWKSKGILVASRVAQKAIIEVDEEGAEAAAVTYIGISGCSGYRGPEFIANRPFVFSIREDFGGNTIFIGRIEDPAGVFTK